MTRIARGFDVAAGTQHLLTVDRKLARWLSQVEPVLVDPCWRKSFDVVDALARAILYQQLAGKAAATIVGRLEVALGTTRLHTEAFDQVDDLTLRACGVSGNKARALRDLADHERRGAIPSLRQMGGQSDDAIIEALTAVRGIGRWTVQMMLMFRLGRPDQLPNDDLGVRRGLQRVDQLDVAPTPRELAARGECWGPYRTLASLYLWRIADLREAASSPPVKRSQG